MNLLLVIALGLAIGAAAHEEDWQGPNSVKACSMTDPLMDPTYEVLHGQDTVWQIPPNPKAVLFLAHGAGGNPFPYFDQGPKCEECLGMPEERSIVLEALRRGYALICVKSLERNWDHEDPDTSEDLPVMVNILNDWSHQHSLEGLPFSVYGMSSGGFFATILAVRVPTRALILMCSEGQTELIENATPGTFPATFFVYMGFDSETVREKDGGSQSLSRAMTSVADVEKAMATLVDRGVRVESKFVSPSPVTPFFFTERIPCMSFKTSEMMQRAYKAEGWLDSDDYLVVEPYMADWKAPLRKWNALPAAWDSNTRLVCSLEPICYELTRAYALHAITADANDEMFPWMDSIVTSSDNQVTRELSSSTGPTEDSVSHL